MIRIERLTTPSQLAPLAANWNALAGDVPFCRYDWLTTWWNSYGGAGRELLVLAARDAHGAVVGLAPWYVERSGACRVIRPLGSGEVASDYLTVLCRAGLEHEVPQAVADWLCTTPTCAATPFEWNRLELSGVEDRDVAIRALVERLARHGQLVQRIPRESCWRLKLPATWEQYLAELSKSHRKKMRKLDLDYFGTGRAQVSYVETSEQLAHGFEWLARLHQQRHESLGHRGSFASAQFAQFHQQMAQQLLADQRLRIALLEIDGRTAAVEYQLIGGDTVYGYQAGIDPEALEQQPGRLILMVTLKQAIAEGRRVFDFLRGDEPYKAHWRAEPSAALEICVSRNTPSERLRHHLRVANRNVRGWIKRGLQYSGVIKR